MAWTQKPSNQWNQCNQWNNAGSIQKQKLQHWTTCDMHPDYSNTEPIENKSKANERVRKKEHMRQHKLKAIKSSLMHQVGNRWEFWWCLPMQPTRWLPLPCRQPSLLSSERNFRPDRRRISDPLRVPPVPEHVMEGSVFIWKICSRSISVE
jgi:hypothetical protein